MKNPLSSQRPRMFLHWIALLTIYVISSASTGAVDFPVSSAPAQGLPAESLAKLTDLVRDYLDRGQFVGAELIVIKNRHTVLHETFGWKDREDSIAMTSGTAFGIRSMTKPLTGAAVQVLIDEGKIKLSDRVADYLPGFQQGKSSAITIEQLLTHRSGLPLTILTNLADFTKLPSLQAMANAIGKKGPQFEPGSRFYYSDAGADVLAAVVEVVSGQSLHEFLQEKIFAPLGMDRTFYLTGCVDVPTTEIASLYGGLPGNWMKFWKKGDDPFLPYPMGSISIYCPPVDYARFLAMLMDGGRDVLSNERVNRVLGPVSAMTSLGSVAPYPTGFPGLKVFHGQMCLVYMDSTAGSDAPPVAIGYAGSDGTFAWAWPQQDLIVLFFTQSRGSQLYWTDLETNLHLLLVDPDAALTTPTLPKEYESLLGGYTANFGPYQNATFTILYRNGNLALDIPGQTVFDLNEPDETGWWTFKVSDLIAVSFERNQSDEVATMRMRQTTRLTRNSESIADTTDVSDDLKAFIGNYLLPTGEGALVITCDSGQLVLRDPSGKLSPLVKDEYSQAWYIGGNHDRVITFLSDEKGWITTMNVSELVSLMQGGT